MLGPAPSRSTGASGDHPLGWVIVAVVGFLLLVPTTSLALEGPVDMSDPGFADFAWFVSPVVAIGGALVTCVVIAICSAVGLLQFAAREVGLAALGSVIAAPIGHLATVMAITSLMSAAAFVPDPESVLGGLVLFPLAALAGVAYEAIATVMLRAPRLRAAARLGRA